jgi:hypothetical protein
VNNPFHKTLALVPPQLFSLWEMNQIVARKFLEAWTGFEREFEKSEVTPSNQVATEVERIRLFGTVVSVQHQCFGLGLKRSNELCHELLNMLGDSAWHHDKLYRPAVRKGLPSPPFPKEIKVSFDAIYPQLRLLFKTIQQEMDGVRLAVILSQNAKLFEQDELFGKQVKDSASQELNAEIKAAGNCLATDLNTAAIFHLMRAVELTMRSVVFYLKINVRNKPVEHAGWDTLVKLIEKDTRRRKEKYDRSKRKKKAHLEHCKSFRIVADELNFFKEIWRDNTMHTQRLYSAAEAIGVFERVKDFMRRLAKTVPLK